jgi:hypothetical protein
MLPWISGQLNYSPYMVSLSVKLHDFIVNGRKGIVCWS